VYGINSLIIRTLDVHIHRRMLQQYSWYGIMIFLHELQNHDTFIRWCTHNMFMYMNHSAL